MINSKFLIYGNSETNLVPFLTSIFSFFILFKIQTKENPYLKIQFLLPFIFTLGFYFVLCNLNFILPIYWLIELGTVLFLLTVIKGFINSFFFKNNSVANQVTFIFFLFFILLFFIKKNIIYKAEQIIFIDFFLLDTKKNEFAYFGHSILITQQPVLFFILLSVKMVTAFLILNSFKHNSFYSKKKNIYDVFQKTNSLFFFLKKNKLLFFSGK